MINQNFDFLEDNYGNKLISKVFGENHSKIKNFEDLKESIKLGKVCLNFKYDSKLIREFSNNQDSGFYYGVKKLKNFGAIIFIAFNLIINHDYNFLYIVPILFLIRSIIFFLWYKKLITSILLVLITTTSCYYLNLNYKIFLISFILLQSITLSAYLTCLEQYFSFDEIRFGHGIKGKLITYIYDGYEKKIIEV